MPSDDFSFRRPGRPLRTEDDNNSARDDEKPGKSSPDSKPGFDPGAESQGSSASAWKARDFSPKATGDDAGQGRRNDDFGDEKPFRSARPAFGNRGSSSGDRNRAPGGDRPQGSFGDRPRSSSYGDKPRSSSFGDRPRPSFGDRRPSFGDRDRSKFGDRPKPSFGDRDRPASYGDRPQGGNRWGSKNPESESEPLAKPFSDEGFSPKPETPPSKDVVFGIRATEEVLKSGRQVDRLLVDKGAHGPALKELLTQAEQAGVAVTRVPPDRLDRITRKNHQGVICYISPVNFVELSNVIADVFERGEVPLILILDRITDVRNLGAIARSAECAGVHALVVPAKGSAQIGGDAMKTSAGALNHLHVCRENNLAQTIQMLQDSGIHVAACTEKGEDQIWQTDMNRPLAIIMGSEEDGVSTPLIRKADSLMQIPLAGKIGSLNVSVAAALAVFEAVRQRQAAVNASEHFTSL